MMSTNPISRPQTFESLQGYVVPPHCSANNKQTTAEIRKNAPRKSIFFSFCLTVNVNGPRLFGGVKNRATDVKAIAPNGRLIC